MGWPRCAYTVSKVAVNAYTRILQKQLDLKGNFTYIYEDKLLKHYFSTWYLYISDYYLQLTVY